MKNFLVLSLMISFLMVFSLTVGCQEQRQMSLQDSFEPLDMPDTIDATKPVHDTRIVNVKTKKYGVIPVKVASGKNGELVKLEVPKKVIDQGFRKNPWTTTSDHDGS